MTKVDVMVDIIVSNYEPLACPQLRFASANSVDEDQEVDSVMSNCT